MLMVIRNHLLWSGIGRLETETCVADITGFELERPGCHVWCQNGPFLGSWFGPLSTGGETAYAIRIAVASLFISFRIILI